MHNVHMNTVPSRTRGERLCTNHVPSKVRILTGNHKAHSRSLSLITHSSSGLDSQGLFSSNSSLLGPSAPSMGPSTGSSAASALNIDDVPLESGVSVNQFHRRHSYSFFSNTPAVLFMSNKQQLLPSPSHRLT